MSWATLSLWVINMRSEGEQQESPPSVEPYNRPNTPRVAATQLPPLPVILPGVSFLRWTPAQTLSFATWTIHIQR